MTLTRRKFLINSSILGAGMGLAGFTSLPTIPKNQPLKLGIIGTGSRGMGLARLVQNEAEIEITGMCDVIPFRLKKALTFGNAQTKAYKDYRKLLEDKNIDAVIISTPFGMHSQMAIDALEADKHVYCEKTLAYGIEPTRKLLAKTQASSKIFQTGHQYHSSRLYRHVIDLVQKKGYLGEIAHIECQWNRNGDWRRPVPEPSLERQINWRMYREHSGGLTAELCSHQIDFSNWLLKDHPIRVTGFGGIDYWKDGRETYDNIHFVTEYPSGVKASFTCLTTNSKDDYKIKVLGKKGSIVLDYKQAWAFSEQKIKETELGLVDGVSGATVKAWREGKGVALDVEHKDPTLQALLDFKENIRQNKKPLSNAETGATVSIIVQMALNAMDNKSVETWKEDYNFVSNTIYHDD